MNLESKIEDPLKSVKVRLILPAGGAKGIFQLGFLSNLLNKPFIEVIEVHGISIGSIIAPFAITNSMDIIEDIYKDMIQIKKDNEILLVKDWSYVKYPWIDGKEYDHILSDVFRIVYLIIKLALFKELDVELLFSKLEERITNHKHLQEKLHNMHIYAVDINEGQMKHFSFGTNDSVNWIDAIRASTAAPGLLPPVKLENNTYVDGAVIDTYPIDEINASYNINTYTIILDFDENFKIPQFNDQEPFIVRKFLMYLKHLVRIMSHKIISGQIRAINENKFKNPENIYHYTLTNISFENNEFSFNKENLEKAYFNGKCKANEFLSLLYPDKMWS